MIHASREANFSLSYAELMAHHRILAAQSRQRCRDESARHELESRKSVGNKALENMSGTMPINLMESMLLE